MAGKPSVLVVDDNASIRRTMALVLERKGYETEAAASGQEALERIRQRPYDLVFMDVRMPVMDGAETYKRIRDVRPDAAVVLMTGYAVEEMVEDAVRHGARGVLHKPLDLQEVFQLVEEAQHGGQGAFILVVEDDSGTARTFEQILRTRGYTVGVASTGEQAIEMAAQRHYDILFVDMKLPTLNGLETYLAIREIDAEATCIVMTGYREEMADLVKGALDVSAHTCLYKPLDMDHVLGLVAGIVKTKRPIQPTA